MDRFYEEMRGAVHAHGGTVAKFIGDAVMAVWGTPVVREDDALRAVRAAEEMRGALAALNLDLDQRWGVPRRHADGREHRRGRRRPDEARRPARRRHAERRGAARAGGGRRRGARRAGDLPARPRPGDARAGRAAAAQGQGRAGCPPTGSSTGCSPSAPRTERLRAPLVGRDAELARLRAAFDAAVAARRDAPGDRRRLAGRRQDAACRRSSAARLEDEARVLRGHCEPVTEGATFLPVAEVLREAAGLGEGADGDVRERLAAAVPGEPDPRVLDALAALLGEGGGAGHRRGDVLGGPPVPRGARPRAARSSSSSTTCTGASRRSSTSSSTSPAGAATRRCSSSRWPGPELRDIRPALCETSSAGRRRARARAARARGQPRARRRAARRRRPARAAGRARCSRPPTATRSSSARCCGCSSTTASCAARATRGSSREAEHVSVPPTIHALLAARLERLPAARAHRRRARRGDRPAVLRAPRSPSWRASRSPRAIDEHLDALRRKELITTAAGPGRRAGASASATP